MMIGSLPKPSIGLPRRGALLGKRRTVSNARSMAQLVADGIWTYYTRPEAVVRAPWYYIGWVNKTGGCGVTRYNPATSAIETVTLNAAVEQDDHNNTALYFTPSGALVAFYNSHNSSIIRYRVLSDLAQFTTVGGSGWSAEQQRGTNSGPFSYMNPITLAKDSARQFLFFRRWTVGGGGRRALSYWTVTDFGTVPATFNGSYQDIYTAHPDSGDVWPYWNQRNNGYDRIDFISTDSSPPGGQTGVYHWYAQLDGSNVLRFYKTDGTEITASKPFYPSDTTQVYDGSTVRAWVGDVKMHADGNPRLLWVRYPDNTSGNTTEYWYSRWTGSAWVSQKLCDAGRGFDQTPYWYFRGLTFDSVHDDRYYLARQIGGVGTIEEWRTLDAGTTHAQHRVIRSSADGGVQPLARPVSPYGHDGSLVLVWHEGTFTNFNSYDTSLVGAG